MSSNECFMLSVVYAESCMQAFYAECYFAECQYAECHVTIKESEKYFVNYDNTQSVSTVLHIRDMEPDISL
jgi:hypothetical protein